MFWEETCTCWIDLLTLPPYFGQTVNTTERIEGTGLPGKIHVSEDFAKHLLGTDKAHWLEKREEQVSAKGKGKLTVRLQ